MEQTKGEKLTKEELLKLTSRVVRSHVANNMVASGDLAGFIQETYHNLDTLANPVPKKDDPVPAVPVKQSVKKDHIVCLECGKKLKVLKRHLRAEHEMDISDYIEKWKLPYGYPTVASDYAEWRSKFAKEVGLGKEGGSPKKSSPKKAAVTKTKSTAKKGRKPVEDFEEDEAPNASASDEDIYEENEQVAEETEGEVKKVEASAEDVEDVEEVESDEGDEGDGEESFETVEDYERVPDDHYAE